MTRRRRKGAYSKLKPPDKSIDLLDCATCGINHDPDQLCEERDIYLQYLDAHPDFSSDELGRMALEDFARVALAWWIDRQEDADRRMIAVQAEARL